MPACRPGSGNRSRVVRYYLHRWASGGDETAQERSPGPDRPQPHRSERHRGDVIADLNPLLRGWGNYFRTGNAAVGVFSAQADRYVAWRLKRLLIKKRGRNLRAGQTAQWTEEWMHGLGLHKLSGTVRYPKAA